MQKKKNLRLFYLAYIILGFTVPIFDPLYPYFSNNFYVGYDKTGIVFFLGSPIGIISTIISGIISERFPLKKFFCGLLQSLLPGLWYLIYYRTLLD